MLNFKLTRGSLWKNVREKNMVHLQISESCVLKDIVGPLVDRFVDYRSPHEIFPKLAFLVPWCYQTRIMVENIRRQVRMPLCQILFMHDI